MKTPPGSDPAGPSVLRFARAVAVRYARFEGRVRLRLVWLAPLRAPTARASIVRRTTHLTVHRRLALTLVERAAAVSRARPRRPARTVALRARPATRSFAPVHSLAAPPAVRSERVRLVERVVAIGRRIDGRPRLGSAPAAGMRALRVGTSSRPADLARAAPWTPPVPRVYAAAGAQPAQLRAAPAGDSPRRPDSPAQLESREPLLAAEPDLARLTDSVVEAIDRRIVARRERFGRP